ncbi:MAG: hypothetical protein M1838_003348 [Thelocarpon superellum]|nr:MAG: hypothetical protein M1838_003348 [Thelocarpon superellum]
MLDRTDQMLDEGDPGPANDGTATEESPLLGDGLAKPADQENVDAAEDTPHRDDDDEPETDVPIPNEPSPQKFIVICASVYFGVFLAALDSTIFATLTAPISTSFRSLSLLSWLASSYLISNAASQPLSGRLTDIFSRRAGLVFCNLFFALGNLLCGLAKSPWVIILGRVVAGIGGGGMLSISTFVFSDLVPLRRRGVIQGIGNICYGAGAGLGGVFGGWVNDVWGWRLAFLIQVPLVLLSTILVYSLISIPVKASNKSRLRRVDFLGAALLVASLVVFLLGLNAGGNFVPWTHPLVIVSIPLAAVIFAGFIYVEEKVASEPIIPVRLLLNRTVASACLTNWFLTLGVFALIFYLPIFFQIQGLSTTQAGVRLIPQSIGAAIGSLGTGLIMNKTGRYWHLNVGVQLTYLTATALICSLDLDTPTWPPFLYLFLAGVGYGGMLTITLLALISAVEHADQAVITSASYAFRSTGSTIGITVCSAVFQNLLKMQLWARFGGRSDAAHVIAKLRESFDEIRHLPPDWRPGVLQSYVDALRGVFLTCFGFAALGLVASLFMREHTLHRNLSRRREEESDGGERSI